MRPWNELVENRAFWDPSLNDGRGGEYSQTQTLKDRLSNHSAKTDPLLIDVAKGLVMVMNAIDEQDSKKNKKTERPNFLKFPLSVEQVKFNTEVFLKKIKDDKEDTEYQFLRAKNSLYESLDGGRICQEGFNLAMKMLSVALSQSRVK